MIDKILDERARTHGDFEEVAGIAQVLKNTIRTGKTVQNMRLTQTEAVDMICSKLARIVCGNSCETDHWRDIIGYATLVLKELEKQEKNKDEKFTI